MQVICSQCHAVCDIPPDASPTARCATCGAVVSAQDAPPPGAMRWLVLSPSGQAGPYDASQMAQLLEHGRMDWSTLVWRQGLKGWRAARRDPQLVTASAAAGGQTGWGDTQRVSSRRSLVPGTDTVVQPGPPVEPPQDEAAPDWDEGDRTLLSPRPVENTLAHAFRSAPRLMSTMPEVTSEPSVPARRSSPTSWLPSAQSMLIVALLAFGAGVLVAALWGRITRLTSKESALLVRPQPVPKRPTETAPPPARAPLDVAVTSIPAPEHKQPTEAALRREVKRVSPEVRRCVTDLARGAELEIRFDGRTGMVRDARLRTLGLSPGRLECITQAVRQMQVEPFAASEFRFVHRFSYGP